MVQPMSTRREDVVASPPSEWHAASHRRRAVALYAGLAGLGASLLVLYAVAGSSFEIANDLASGGLDEWVFWLLPAVLIVGFGLAAVHAGTWSADVDEQGTLRAGSVLRRKRVDLRRLEAVSLRPEGDAPSHRALVRLIVRDRSGGSVVVALDWHPIGWRALHLLAWHATAQEIVLSGPVRMALAGSDSPVLRRLLDRPSPRAQGAVACRFGPRRTRSTLYACWFWALVLGYASTLGEWSWLHGGAALVALGLIAVGLWALLVRGRRRLEVDEDGTLRAGGRQLQLDELVVVDMGSVGPDGPVFERLAHLGLNGLISTDEPPVGPDLRLVDATGAQLTLRLDDTWEPMASLMSRVLTAVAANGLEVSTHARYNLRFAAGDVPLAEHWDVVAATTGQRSPLERRDPRAPGG